MTEVKTTKSYLELINGHLLVSKIWSIKGTNQYVSIILSLSTVWTACYLDGGQGVSEASLSEIQRATQPVLPQADIFAPQILQETYLKIGSYYPKLIFGV